LDDTDSPKGGCTTYIAALLVSRLQKLGAEFVDYPNLVRLNPNVPWKTRGNGAINLSLELDKRLEGTIKKAVLDAVERYAEFKCENTNPGIVFHVGQISQPLKRFARRVIQEVVTLEEAEKLINEHCSTAIGFKNRRGLIGALAAIGETLEGDYTYEFLSYRASENRGKTRNIDIDSIVKMDESTRGETFNNFDHEAKRPLIAPHGPDPVLFGIRGKSADSVHRAGMMIETDESIERWVIFRTNQGTDAHIKRLSKLSDLKPYNPALVVGEVSNNPRTIPGGHVIFSIKDETGDADCAAYEPTGRFRNVVRRLIPGDRTKTYGGVRPIDKEKNITINLEKLEILQLAPDLQLVNPSCLKCGGSMESMGRGKGYRCRKCNFRDGSLRKLLIEKRREINPGLYLPTPGAQRHLTKPLERYGREKTGYDHGELYQPWHWP